MELERDIELRALLPKREDPVVVTWARVGAGFPAGRDFFDFFRVEIYAYIERRQQGSGDDGSVAYRQREKDRQAVVRHLLILHRAADYDVLIAAAPAGRQTFRQTVDALGEEIEEAVLPAADHIPAVLPPWVGIAQQKV